MSLVFGDSSYVPWEDDGGFEEADMFPTLESPPAYIPLPPPPSIILPVAVGTAAGMLLLGPVGALLGAGGGYAHAKSKQAALSGFGYDSGIPVIDPNDISNAANAAGTSAADDAKATQTKILVAAAVAVPLVGLVAYMLLRKKKKGHVAGYRRRRSRR